MRLLLDTNIILDIALKREKFYDDSAFVFQKIDNQNNYGFITATTVTDIYYIAKKDKGHQEAINFINDLIQIVDILGIDKEIILESLSSKSPDFEDSIQSAAAASNGIDFIITRNIQDFKKSTVKALSPVEFLKL